ncbi:anthranilate phosphoribosyltransferase [candidate division KSB1 bacterium]|jgi:anthranilate phosphoribosyltransferase|nr:anthranilate phosphoribosyltransferase [candidate division KSB1 bacterium]
MISEILSSISEHQHLERLQARKVMSDIMQGQWTSAQIAALLMALKMKGETVQEITGFVDAMRDHAQKIKGPVDMIDTCGTGGDGRHTFNISTAAAIVAAAAGVTVAKHGNRSVSSKSGSADILQALGVKIDLTPQQAEICLNQIGIAFLFAPLFHGSMKYAVAPRKEMGIRTVFNILGPMSNPAGARRQLVGAFNRPTAEKMTQVLHATGSEHVMVVHSDDGLDEISISHDTHITELKNSEINSYTFKPEEAGIDRFPADTVRGGTPEENARIMMQVLQGEDGGYGHVTALNGGAAIYVAGKSKTLHEGIEIAQELLKDGSAKRKLDELVETTHSLS